MKAAGTVLEIIAYVVTIFAVATFLLAGCSEMCPRDEHDWYISSRGANVQRRGAPITYSFRVRCRNCNTHWRDIPVSPREFELAFEGDSLDYFNERRLTLHADSD